MVLGMKLVFVLKNNVVSFENKITYLKNKILFIYVARGACCVASGNCNDRMSPDACASIQGSFDGVGTKCQENTCGKN